MKYLFVTVILLSAWSGLCQQFKSGYNIVLPDSLSDAEPMWVDIDNDGLLDIVIVTTSNSGKRFLQWIKTDTLNVSMLQSQSLRLPDIITATLLSDYDHDNKMDILVSGVSNGNPLTIAYINQGSFSFIARTIIAQSFSSMRMADIDGDARLDLAVSGESGGNYFFRILTQINDVSWRIAHDSISMLASSIQVADYNKDGISDLYLSGKVKPDSVVSVILLNHGGLFFKPLSSRALAGISSSSDINEDGTYDVLTMGQTKSGSTDTKLFQSNSGTFMIVDQEVKLSGAIPLLADLNSDGVADVNYFGKLENGDTLSLNKYSSLDYDTLLTKQVKHQKFGDFEHDGDLDVVMIAEQSDLHVLLFKNTIVRKNVGPKAPKNQIAHPVFDRTFIYWDKTSDDHTNAASITYDLHLEGSTSAHPGSFDLLNEKRLVVSHGNNGMNNFALLRDLAPVNLQFAIQGVDNALHAGALCIGSASNCAAIVPEALALCTNESVRLTAPDKSMWFSFANGYLGEHTSYDVQDKSDTIFYYSPAQSGCAGLKVYTININNDTVKTKLSDRYVCTDADLNFSVEAGWKQIQWSSTLKGDLGNAPTIQYKVSQPDSVFVSLANDQDCVIKRKTAIKLSKPALNVAEDNLKIEKGGSVQLSAGGAQRYEWAPSTGLNRPDQPDPAASPLITTLYSVTGYDSVGCSSTLSVNVIVEDGGFIPTLFTPNDDGKNDDLKIYGLATVNNFSFSIYNRDGAIVFKTSSIAEAAQRGWDGTRNGTKQPPGVYFWKVKGEGSTGSKILLNGKDSGSIVLVR